MMKLIVLSTNRPEKLQIPLQTTSLNYEFYPLNKNITSLSYWKTLLSAMYISLNNDYDAILCTGGGLVGVMTIGMSFVTSLDSLIRLNGNPLQSNREARRRALQDKAVIRYIGYYAIHLSNVIAIKYSDGVLTVSSQLKNEIIGMRNDTSVEFVPIHVNIYGEPVKTKGCTDGLQILTVTNLGFEGKYQGVKKSVDRLQPFLRKQNEVNYVIAGGGRYLGDLQNYIQSLDEDVKGNIEVKGYVSQIINIYENSDIFLYISYIDGYPNVILEAQYAKLPIISNRNHGMIDQISHMEDGFLVNPDLSDFEKYMSELLEDSELREKFSQKAHETVVRRNSPKKIGANIEEKIHKMVAAS